MALLDDLMGGFHRLVTAFRAWSERESEKSIHAPLIPSQGELWRSMRGFSN
jgi:hypothetical protein